MVSNCRFGGSISLDESFVCDEQSVPATVEIDLSCLRRRLFSLAVIALFFSVSGNVRNISDRIKSTPAEIRKPGNHIPTHL
jgi:hypothetical protein